MRVNLNIFSNINLKHSRKENHVTKTKTNFTGLLPVLLPSVHIYYYNVFLSMGSLLVAKLSQYIISGLNIKLHILKNEVFFTLCKSENDENKTNNKAQT